MQIYAVTILQIIALGANYFRQFWNIFDFIIVILSIADMMVTFFLRPEEEMRNVCEDTTNIHDFLNPSMLKIAKVFRLLRLLRSFRLVRVRSGVQLVVRCTLSMCVVLWFPVVMCIVFMLVSERASE